VLEQATKRRRKLAVFQSAVLAFSLITPVAHAEGKPAEITSGVVSHFNFGKAAVLTSKPITDFNFENGFYGFDLLDRSTESQAPINVNFSGDFGDIQGLVDAINVFLMDEENKPVADTVAKVKTASTFELETHSADVGSFIKVSDDGSQIAQLFFEQFEASSLPGQEVSATIGDGQDSAAIRFDKNLVNMDTLVTELNADFDLDHVDVTAQILDADHFTLVSDSAGSGSIITVTGSNASFLPDGNYTGTDSDATVVANAKSALRIGYQNGDSASAVKQNLILPTRQNDADVSWSSDRPDIVAADGSVTRPTYSEGDGSARLTATVSKGSASDTVVFDLTVKKREESDEEAVAFAKSQIAITYSGSDTAAAVTQNVYLPTESIHGASIVWESSNSSVIDNGGIVHRPAHAQGDAQVTLTAKVSKNAAQSSADFPVNVSALPDSASNPSNGTPDPSNGTPDPSSGTPDPSSGTPDPSNGTPDPSSGTPDPSNGTPDPSNGTPDPSNGTPDPSNGTPDPSNGTPDPSNGTPDPSNGTPDPSNGTPDPSNGTPDPSNGTPDPSNGTSVTISLPVSTPAVSSPVVPDGLALTDATQSLLGGSDQAIAAPVDVTILPSGTKLVRIRESQLLASLNAVTTKSVVVPLALFNGKSETVLTPGFMTEFGSKQAGSSLILQGSGVTYRLPASLVDTKAVSAALGLDTNQASDAEIHVVVRSLEDDETRNKLFRDGQPLSQAAEFSIIVTVEGRAYDFNSFNGIYIERSFELSRTPDIQSAVGVTLRSDGSVSPVPTTFMTVNNRPVAIVKADHNSPYAIVQHNVALSDISSSWARSSIQVLANKKIVNGYENGTFEPASKVTRAEFITMIANGLGMNPSANSRFADVPASAWYSGALQAAAERNFVDGYSDGSFQGDRPITRQEEAVILDRVLLYLTGTSGAGDTSKLSDFSDASAVPQFAGASIANLVEAGIMQGDNHSRLNPRQSVTRAETAVLIANLLRKTGMMD